jgi:hypothetical protein
VVGLNGIIGFNPSPIDNWISKGNTYINKQNKTCRFVSTPEDPILSQKM